VKLRMLRRSPTSVADRLALAGCLVFVTMIVQGCSNIREAQIDRMIANAKSPADHEALAAAYQQESERNKEEAAIHLKIAESYDQTALEIRLLENLPRHSREVCGAREGGR
jgi:hypothetical protein